MDRPPTNPKDQVLPCADPRCPQCRLPFAVVQAGVLIIESRHGGEVHRNVLTLEWVLEQLRSSALPTSQETPAA